MIKVIVIGFAVCVGIAGLYFWSNPKTETQIKSFVHTYWDKTGPARTVNTMFFVRINFDYLESNPKNISLIERAKEFKQSNFVQQTTIKHYADVSITLDGVTKEFTVEEFMKKLGFKCVSP